MLELQQPLLQPWSLQIILELVSLTLLQFMFLGLLGHQLSAAQTLDTTVRNLFSISIVTGGTYELERADWQKILPPIYLELIFHYYRNNFPSEM